VIRTLTVHRLAPFRRLLPTDLYFWLKALLLALVGVQLVRLTWIVVTPVGPFGDWRPATPRLMSAEAQTALFATVDPFFRSAGATSATPTQATLVDVQLFGTRAGGAGVSGSAVLGQAEGEQKSYVVGEEVAPGVKLLTVAFDHVVLDRGGARQTLHMPQSDTGTGAESAPETGAAASPSMADAFDLKPRQVGSAVTGVIVNPGQSPAAFQSAGFRPGDVIVAVNGARISSLIDVQQLQSGIVPGARLTLTVERGAQTIPIALNIPATR
jgi:general secretion pathway protein C